MELLWFLRTANNVVMMPYLLVYVDKKELETKWQEISVESVASAVGWAVYQ